MVLDLLSAFDAVPHDETMEMQLGSLNMHGGAAGQCPARHGEVVSWWHHSVELWAAFGYNIFS